MRLIKSKHESLLNDVLFVSKHCCNLFVGRPVLWFLCMNSKKRENQWRNIGQLVYTTKRNHSHQLYSGTYSGKFFLENSYLAERVIGCKTFRIGIASFALFPNRDS